LSVGFGGGAAWVDGDAPPPTTTRGARVEAVVALAFKTAVTDDPCRWAGVTCVHTSSSSSGPRVVGVAIAGNNLSASTCADRCITCMHCQLVLESKIEAKLN
jgi:hypothetical protein